MEKIKNIIDLRNSLLDVYDKIRSGKIGIREAKENANVAGKIISTAKLQLEYNAYMKTQSPIEFLEV
jgi:hypothetical protein